MLPKDKLDVVQEVEFRLSEIRDQDLLYAAMRELVLKVPNDTELAEAVRILFSITEKK
jgi:hypothetical protein